MEHTGLVRGHHAFDKDCTVCRLQAENKKLREIKCPPISDGDSCICPIEELEGRIKRVCDLINNEGKVSKWKILNWLNEPRAEG